MGAPINRRMLATALALSLTAHLIIAAFVRVHPVDAVTYPPTPFVITHIYVHPKPTPPPSVRPQPHHVNVAFNTPDVHRPESRTHVPRLPNSAGPPVPPSSTGEPHAPGNTGNTGGGGTSGPPVAPAETAGPACSDPNVDAKTLTAIAPDDASVAEGSNVTAMIKVDLDANGGVLNVSVYASTGSVELDQAAMRAARESTYAPEVRDCRAVAGSYLFKVEFSN